MSFALRIGIRAAESELDRTNSLKGIASISPANVLSRGRFNPYP